MTMARKIEADILWQHKVTKRELISIIYLEVGPSDNARQLAKDWTQSEMAQQKYINYTLQGIGQLRMAGPVQPAGGYSNY